jgi:hypothetical protein
MKINIPIRIKREFEREKIAQHNSTLDVCTILFESDENDNFLLSITYKNYEFDTYRL